MRLNREPTIRRRDEASARHPYKLSSKLPLVDGPANMLDNSIRMDDVEFVIGKRK
jgi:hypothetical protein